MKALALLYLGAVRAAHLYQVMLELSYLDPRIPEKRLVAVKVALRIKSVERKISKG